MTNTNAIVILLLSKQRTLKSRFELLSDVVRRIGQKTGRRPDRNDIEISRTSHICREQGVGKEFGIDENVGIISHISGRTARNKDEIGRNVEEDAARSDGCGEKGRIRYVERDALRNGNIKVHPRDTNVGSEKINDDGKFGLIELNERGIEKQVKVNNVEMNGNYFENIQEAWTSRFVERKLPKKQRRKITTDTDAMSYESKQMKEEHDRINNENITSEITLHDATLTKQNEEFNGHTMYYLQEFGHKARMIDLDRQSSVGTIAHRMKAEDLKEINNVVNEISCDNKIILETLENVVKIHFDICEVRKRSFPFCLIT